MYIYNIGFEKKMDVVHIYIIEIKMYIYACEYKYLSYKCEKKKAATILRTPAQQTYIIKLS